MPRVLLAGAGITLSISLPITPLPPTMRNPILLLGLSITFLGALVPMASAETIPTMNQPNNGFYEGPNPEWASLHSANGTAAHRQYHRDAVQAHILWHDQHRSEQGTAAHVDAHRLYHQQMNLSHRQFHTAPPTP